MLVPESHERAREGADERTMRRLAVLLGAVLVITFFLPMRLDSAGSVFAWNLDNEVWSHAGARVMVASALVVGLLVLSVSVFRATHGIRVGVTALAATGALALALGDSLLFADYWLRPP